MDTAIETGPTGARLLPVTVLHSDPPAQVSAGRGSGA